VSGIAFCQGRFSGLQGWCSIWGAQAVIPLVAYSRLSRQFRVERPHSPPFYAISRTPPARNSFGRLLTAHNANMTARPRMMAITRDAPQKAKPLESQLVEWILNI
jgi:hypothetical protein